MYMHSSLSYILGGETTKWAKRLVGEKRLGGKRLGRETVWGRNIPDSDKMRSIPVNSDTTKKSISPHNIMTVAHNIKTLAQNMKTIVRNIKTVAQNKKTVAHNIKTALCNINSI